MIIKSLAIDNFRSHRRLAKRFSPNVTVVTGPNGSGKTSLIEAITVALSGHSFKATDAELLRHGADWWRIELRLDDENRVVKFQPDATNKKQFIIDDKTSLRLSKSSHYPVVLFEPDDLQLLHGSPARRRRFIDRFAAQLMPDYSRVLHRYERALLQRNKLLKTNSTNEALFAWNVSLAKYGAHIADVRSRLVERLNAGMNHTYRTIAQTRDTVSLYYPHTTTGNSEQRILTELETHIERDRVLGYTSIGPHRHDIVFHFNDALAAGSASRGEVRTIILALKFLEVDILEEVTGHVPIVLLDDVLSELDDKRQAHLATKFRKNQIIMTSTNPPTAVDTARVIRLR